MGGIDDATHRELLGHVFAANMTGNVVLLGFALVGAPGFSVAASVVSVASFTVVALVGGGWEYGLRSTAATC